MMSDILLSMTRRQKGRVKNFPFQENMHKQIQDQTILVPGPLWRKRWLQMTKEERRALRMHQECMEMLTHQATVPLLSTILG